MHVSKLKVLFFSSLDKGRQEEGVAGSDVKSGFGACEAPLCSTDAEVVLLVECFFLFCNVDDSVGHKYLPALLNT